MSYLKKIWLAAALMPGFLLRGQDVPQVEARFSADSVLIGDHFRLDVRITKDVMQVVDFPTFDHGKLSRTGEIEILKEGPVDTLKTEGRRVTLERVYTLTGFEEGNYRMGRFPMLYVDKNIVDTVWSRDSLRILVNTIPVDTLTQKIHDVKPPMQTPLRFGEYGGYLLRSLLALLAVAAVVWFVVRKYRKRPLFGNRQPAPEPPHVAAIRRLEKLHAQKLWQSGKQKLYYTGMTDILREYIGRRYPIKAMEMTSQEILDRLAGDQMPERPYGRLRDILLTADFVKFAKYVPDADRNEQLYTDAYYFVEETKPDEIEHPTPVIEPIDAESAARKEEKP